MRAADRHALTTQDARQIQVVSKLEEVGFISEDGEPLMLMPEQPVSEPDGNGSIGNEQSEAP